MACSMHTRAAAFDPSLPQRPGVHWFMASAGAGPDVLLPCQVGSQDGAGAPEADPRMIHFQGSPEFMAWVTTNGLESPRDFQFAFSSAEEASAALRIEQPSVVVSDIRMSGNSGLELLNEINAKFPKVPKFQDLGPWLPEVVRGWLGACRRLPGAVPSCRGAVPD